MSPAVVVPSVLTLQEKGLGVDKGESHLVCESVRESAVGYFRHIFSVILHSHNPLVGSFTSSLSSLCQASPRSFWLLLAWMMSLPSACLVFSLDLLSLKVMHVTLCVSILVCGLQTLMHVSGTPE